jgi:aspartate ammonia-lyase
MKMANDLRLLASGPATGLREIALPAIQPGSSIMPGKINPVIPEAVNMVAAQIIGNDSVVSIAAMNGNLDLNTMMPVIAHNLLASADLLGNACRVLAEKCVRGITADRQRCLAYAERSSSLVTALAPVVGYEAAARIFARSVRDDVPIRQAILESGMMDAAKIDELLDLERLTRGGRAS